MKTLRRKKVYIIHNCVWKLSIVSATLNKFIFSVILLLPFEWCEPIMLLLVFCSFFFLFLSSTLFFVSARCIVVVCGSATNILFTILLLTAQVLCARAAFIRFIILISFTLTCCCRTSVCRRLVLRVRRARSAHVRVRDSFSRSRRTRSPNQW